MVNTGVEKYPLWGMRECFVAEVWKKRLSYKTIGFWKFFKPLQFLMSKNAFVDCAVSSETLLFPQIPMFGLALCEMPFKANANESEWCLPNVHKQQRTVGNVFYPPEPEEATRQKTPWWQLCCKKGVRQQWGSLGGGRRWEKAPSCPLHSLQLPYPGGRCPPGSGWDGCEAAWLSGTKWLLSLMQQGTVSDVYFWRVFRDHCLWRLAPVCK